MQKQRIYVPFSSGNQTYLQYRINLSTSFGARERKKVLWYRDHIMFANNQNQYGWINHRHNKSHVISERL
ncbi:hypothetical protein BB405_27970 (plasmid) [Escherichia coli]|nr:hypothetical protein BB405_27970 [Escherichia coli]